MADRPKFVRGHPDEWPEDMPIFRDIDSSEQGTFDQEAFTKGRQKPLDPIVLKRVPPPPSKPLLSTEEEEEEKIRCSRIAVRLALDEAKKRDEANDKRKRIYVKKTDCFSIPISPALYALFSAMQDVDRYFIFSYVLSLLCDPVFTSETEESKCWIDLYDVAKKTGYDSRSSVASEAARQKVYDALIFGEHYEVDSLWTIDDKWSNEINLPTDHAPLFVHLKMSQGWQNQIRDPALTRIVPGGNVIGSIPNGQSSNICARMVGLNFLIYGTEASCQPSRKKLLHEFYTLKFSCKKDPKHLFENWIQALQILEYKNIIKDGWKANEEKSWKSISRKNRLQEWLIGTPNLQPGTAIVANGTNLLHEAKKLKSSEIT